MSYTPSISNLYNQCTNSTYRNHILKGCGRDAFFGAIYTLRKEYDVLEAKFTQVSNISDNRYYYTVPKGSVNKPRFRAQMLLSRYLSAIYRVIEVIKFCLATSARVPPNKIDLHPPMSPTLSRWDRSSQTGKQPWMQACDDVLTRFTYLRGIRNAAVHGSLNGFNHHYNKSDNRILISIKPNEFDKDQALIGHSPPNTNYSFSDTYLRFETDTDEALHPLDNIFEYHNSIIDPFVKKFANEL